MIFGCPQTENFQKVAKVPEIKHTVHNGHHFNGTLYPLPTSLHGRIPFPPEFFGSNVPLGSRWVRAAGGSIEERQNESDTLEVFGSGGSGGMIRFFPKILGETWYQR